MFDIREPTSVNRTRPDVTRPQPDPFHCLLPPPGVTDGARRPTLLLGFRHSTSASGGTMHCPYRRLNDQADLIAGHTALLLAAVGQATQQAREAGDLVAELVDRNVDRRQVGVVPG